jgi:hypothetical protein
MPPHERVAYLQEFEHSDKHDEPKSAKLPIGRPHMPLWARVSAPVLTVQPVPRLTPPSAKQIAMPLGTETEA